MDTIDTMDLAEPGRAELTAEDVGVRLRAARELAGLGIKDVAKASGVSKRALEAAERGRKALDPAEAHAVATVLGITAEMVVPSPAPVLQPVRQPDAPLLAPEAPAAANSTWGPVHDEMLPLLDAAARLAACGSTDNPAPLLQRVDEELDALRRSPTFRTNLQRHGAAVTGNPGAGPVR